MLTLWFDCLIEREPVHVYREKQLFNRLEASERRRSALTMLHGKSERGQEEVGSRQVKLPLRPPHVLCRISAQLNHVLLYARLSPGDRGSSILFYFILCCFVLFNIPTTAYF